MIKIQTGLVAAPKVDVWADSIPEFSASAPIALKVTKKSSKTWSSLSPVERLGPRDCESVSRRQYTLAVVSSYSYETIQNQGQPPAASPATLGRH